MEDKMHDVKEVAEFWGVSERTIRQWIKDGEIEYSKKGGTYRFTEKQMKGEKHE